MPVPINIELKQSGDIIKDELGKKQKDLENFKGFYHDVNNEREKIEKDIRGDNELRPIVTSFIIV